MPKPINIDALPQITPTMEKAVMSAYQNFPPYDETETLKVRQLEHLRREFRPGVCCEHQWEPVVPNEENLKFVQAQFEEREISSPQWCRRCGALSLWDNLPDFKEEIRLTCWAYDATAKFFGKPRKERSDAPSQARGKR